MNLQILQELLKEQVKGKGLGINSLSHIREVDAICQVVRCFVDENITHVSGKVDPIDDIEIINLELILADMETVEKRLERVTKMAKQKDKDAMAEEPILIKLREAFENEKPARSVEFTDEEFILAKGMHLLTIKPMLYVANVAEDEVADADNNENVKAVREFAEKDNAQVIVVCAKIEEEMAELEDEEKAMFLEELGIKESGLDQLIKASYKLLGFATYFTAGVQEVRAWTFRKGMKAPNVQGSFILTSNVVSSVRKQLHMMILVEQVQWLLQKRQEKFVLKEKNMLLKTAMLCCSVLTFNMNKSCHLLVINIPE